MVGSVNQKPTVDAGACVEWLKKAPQSVAVSVSDYEDDFERYITYIRDKWWYTTAFTRVVNLSEVGWHRAHVRKLLEGAEEYERIELKKAPFGELVGHDPSIQASEPRA